MNRRRWEAMLMRWICMGGTSDRRIIWWEDYLTTKKDTWEAILMRCSIVFQGRPRLPVTFHATLTFDFDFEIFIFCQEHIYILALLQSLVPWHMWSKAATVCINSWEFWGYFIWSLIASDPKEIALLCLLHKFVCWHSLEEVELSSDQQNLIQSNSRFQLISSAREQSHPMEPVAARCLLSKSSDDILYPMTMTMTMTMIMTMRVMMTMRVGTL